MSKRHVLVRGLLLAMLLPGVAFARSADHSPALLQQAAAINDRIVTLDDHLDIPFDFDSGALDATKDGASQFDLAKAARGHLKGAVIAIFVPQGARDAEGYRQAAAKAEQKYRILEGIARKHPQQVAIVTSPEELEAAERAGKFAIVLQILNGYPIGKDLSQLDAWYRKGVRVFGFTHAGNNDLADSARPNLLRGQKQDEHGGLSPLGKQAVKRLNDLGIVIDVSQITGKALDQVLALTKAPVIASHSNARAIINHPRNLDDAHLLAIARNGGVVAINAYSSWVRQLPPEAIEKANAVRRKYGVPEESPLAAIQPLSEKGVKVLDAGTFEHYSEEFHAITGAPEYRATLKEYVDQLDYVVKKIGIDHVGISSDFNHGGGVIGWNDVGESANVTAELLRRGYGEADIAKLWGGNFLRVWKQVQSLASHTPGA